MAGLPLRNSLTAPGMTWDVWFPQGEGLAQDHVFYLQADANLAPHERHAHSSIGHAIHDGNGLWVADPHPAIPQGAPGSFDEAVWTGSVLSWPPDRHVMLYTGRSMLSPDRQYVQRIGLAVSNDPTMRNWTKHGTPVLVPGDPYCTRDRDHSKLGPIWRDPYLFADNGHVYAAMAARIANATHAHTACIGLARATNESLTQWALLPPLVDGTGRYGEMEVPQVIRHDGLYYIFFTVHARHYNMAWATKVGGFLGGLHCYVTPCLGTPPLPANDTGSVLNNGFVRGLRFVGAPNGNAFSAIGWFDGEESPQGFVGGLSNTFTITLDGLKVSAKPCK